MLMLSRKFVKFNGEYTLAPKDLKNEAIYGGLFKLSRQAGETAAKL